MEFRIHARRDCTSLALNGGNLRQHGRFELSDRTPCAQPGSRPRASWEVKLQCGSRPLTAAMPIVKRCRSDEPLIFDVTPRSDGHANRVSPRWAMSIALGPSSHVHLTVLFGPVRASAMAVAI